MLLSCRIAKRRYKAFTDTVFELVPLRRGRFTWRDNRALQAILGIVQVIHASRRVPIATAHGTPEGSRG